MPTDDALEQARAAAETAARAADDAEAEARRARRRAKIAQRRHDDMLRARNGEPTLPFSTNP